MKIEFRDSKAANNFFEELKENKRTLNMLGQQYAVLHVNMSQTRWGLIEVELTLVHSPKQTPPEWTLGESYLKDLRQSNTSLLKFTEKAIAQWLNVEGKKYLDKYNFDGTEK